MTQILPYHNLDCDESEDLVRKGPCTIVEGTVYNGHSAVNFLKVYDAAAITDVTVGTTVPKLVIGIPPASIAPIPNSDYENGVVIACTAAAALADATDPTVGAVVSLSTQ